MLMKRVWAWGWVALATGAASSVSDLQAWAEDYGGVAMGEEVLGGVGVLAQEYMKVLHEAAEKCKEDELMQGFDQLSEIRKAVYAKTQISRGESAEECLAIEMSLSGLNGLEANLDMLRGLVRGGAEAEDLRVVGKSLVQVSRLKFLLELDERVPVVARMQASWIEYIRLEGVQALQPEIAEDDYEMQAIIEKFGELMSDDKKGLARERSTEQLKAPSERAGARDLMRKMGREGEALISREDGRIEMLRVTLVTDFEHLFAVLSDIAHVPRTHRVVELLEKGIDVFPNLRHHLLTTIYRLGYETKKWHLTSSGKDVEFLRGLISTVDVKAVASAHKNELLELYSYEILNLLMEKGVLTKENMCEKSVYRRLCCRGEFEYLYWAKVNCPELEPDWYCFNRAVFAGNERMVDYIESELGRTMVPTEEAVNEAAKKGKLALLEKRCSVWKRFPDERSVEWVARNGHLEVLKWLAKEHRSVIGQTCAEWAAWNGHLEVLKWLAEEFEMYPTGYGAGGAASAGHWETLKWLAECKIELDQWVADSASWSGHVGMLKWLAEEFGVYPSQKGADSAARKGRVNVLIWLGGLPDKHKVYPSKEGVNLAAENGELATLKWLAAQLGEKMVYPDQASIDWVAHNGYLEVLKWQAELPERHRLYPSEQGADWAAAHGHLKLLKWLAKAPEKYRVYPSQRGADWAAKNGHLSVLKWLAKRGIYPSEEGAYEARRAGHTHVTAWLAECGVKLKRSTS